MGTSENRIYVAMDVNYHFYRFLLPLKFNNDNYFALTYIINETQQNFSFCVPNEWKEYYEGKVVYNSLNVIPFLGENNEQL